MKTIAVLPYDDVMQYILLCCKASA